MNARTVVLSIVAADFAALTAWAIWSQGLVEIFAWVASTPGGILLGVDLLIALSLVTVWMVLDARDRGVNAVPYVLVTLGTGSLGPLLYLVRREWDGQPIHGSARLADG